MKTISGETRNRPTVGERRHRAGMRRSGFLLVALLAGIAAPLVSSAKGITPSMVRRNGLTDEQIDAIFAADTNAQIKLTKRHWRNIEYRLHRFDNMRGWLNEGIEGTLGDHILAVTDTNTVLVASNNTLRATCVSLAETANTLYIGLTNQLAQTAAYSNLYVIVSAQATAATAKIQDEIADLQAKIVTYTEYQTKYPLLKKIFAAMITDAENRIKILQALTGAN